MGCTNGVDGPQWLPAIESCKPIHCGTPTPPNGTTANSCSDDSFGDECTFDCDSNHHPQGGVTMKPTCQADGKWSEVSVHCVPNEPEEHLEDMSVSTTVDILNDGGQPGAEVEVGPSGQAPVEIES